MKSTNVKEQHTPVSNVYPKEVEKFDTPSQFKQIMLKS